MSNPIELHIINTLEDRFVFDNTSDNNFIMSYDINNEKLASFEPINEIDAQNTLNLIDTLKIKKTDVILSKKLTNNLVFLSVVRTLPPAFSASPVITAINFSGVTSFPL